MNIFRLAGDMTHLFSVLVLLLKIYATKSSSGISLKTQELYALVFITRYLDLFIDFISVYNTVMKLVFIGSSLAIVWCMRMHRMVMRTYDKDLDTFRHFFLILAALVLALLVHEKFTFLEVLEIRDYRGLATLTDNLQHLSALSELSLSSLSALEMEIFHSLPHNLFKFELDSCTEENSLPHDMHHLTSLKFLTIRYSEGITSLSSRGGLPPNLKGLYIDGCKNLNQPIEEWGLRGLFALLECFPPNVDDDGEWSRLLPSSLLDFFIGRMKKLERVGGGLRHHLTSLQSLYIYECERLRCLPEDGFPDSLEYFQHLVMSGVGGEMQEEHFSSATDEVFSVDR